MPLSIILARIVARTGVAIWRQRIAWLGAAFAIGAIGVYQLASAGPTLPPVDGDCADATIAAVTSTSDETAHAAYQCLIPGLRSTPEAIWIQGMWRTGTPRGQWSRVADTRTSDGGQIVFYTVEGSGGALGYIVYLDAQGRVRGVE